MRAEVMSFVLSGLLAAALTPAMILLARRLGWVARPRPDRWHARPTAMMGGVAIFAGTVAAWRACGPAPPSLLAGSAALFVLGLADDRLRLRPPVKLAGQAAACVLLLAGFARFDSPHGLLVLPLALFWLLAVVNAVNLLDNMDGLAAGVGGLCAASIAAVCLAEGSGTARPLVPVALALAGGCAGFLLHNFPPARIFMGDCGSMFIGGSLAALSVEAARRGSLDPPASLLVPAALLAVPLFDTALVCIARALHGRSVMQGGRDHASHRLVSLGLSERGAALALYALTAAFGVLALAASRRPPLLALPAAALMFTGLLLLGLYLGSVRVYPGPVRLPPGLRALASRLRGRRRLLPLALDAELVPAAFAGACQLSLDGALPDPGEWGMIAALPVVLAAKLVGMALCGAYRGYRRCSGAADVLRACGGSTLGTLLAFAALILLAGPREVPRAPLFFDWLLFTLLAAAARPGCAALQERLRRAARGEAPGRAGEDMA